jgi:hypothetical protein
MPCSTFLTGEQSILSLHSTYGQSMNTTKGMLLFFAEYHLGGMKKAENRFGSLLYIKVIFY